MVRSYSLDLGGCPLTSQQGMVAGTREWRIYDVGGHRSLVSVYPL